MAAFDLIVLQEAAVRFMLAIVLSGLIGIERELHGRPAGLRTHVLVCLGTVTIILGGSLLFESYHSAEWLNYISLDPGRIEAGIVTGIGFIGAGCIIRIGDYVRGLTTAACLWFVAALGIVIGHGLYGVAVAATLAALLVLIVFNKIEHYLPVLRYHDLCIEVSLDSVSEIQEKSMALLSGIGINVMHLSRCLDKPEDTATITFSLRLRHPEALDGVMDTLIADTSVKTVSHK